MEWTGPMLNAVSDIRGRYQFLSTNWPLLSMGSHSTTRTFWDFCLPIVKCRHMSSQMSIASYFVHWWCWRLGSQSHALLAGAVLLISTSVTYSSSGFLFGYTHWIKTNKCTAPPVSIDQRSTKMIKIDCSVRWFHQMLQGKFWPAELVWYWYVQNRSRNLPGFLMMPILGAQLSTWSVKTRKIWID